ncbi:MAG: hypothetical protein E6J23_02680 [Chloroflexi bacterium]|nr:MAG: hypothetical protein E6J23_02680 [Chloroflexota bacterium]
MASARRCGVPRHAWASTTPRSTARPASRPTSSPASVPRASYDRDRHATVAADTSRCAGRHPGGRDGVRRGGASGRQVPCEFRGRGHPPREPTCRRRISHDLSAVQGRRRRPRSRGNVRVLQRRQAQRDVEPEKPERRGARARSHPNRRRLRGELHARHRGAPRPRSRYGSQLSALAGFVQLLGETDSTPVLLYGPYIDYVAVGYGAIAVLAALERRKRTAVGCTIDLSQYEAGLQFLTPTILEFAANGRIPGRAGNADAVAAPHGVYRCAGLDRWVALSVWADGEWRALRALMGIDGPSTAAARRLGRVELDERISKWTASRDRDLVVKLLRSEGIHAAPVLSISELFTDSQLAHRAMWPAVTHPTIGEMRLMAPPFRLSATPSVQERPGPTLGADNDHVFGEILGLSLDERRTLERDGVFE